MAEYDIYCRRVNNLGLAVAVDENDAGPITRLLELLSCLNLYLVPDSDLNPMDIIYFSGMRQPCRVSLLFIGIFINLSGAYGYIFVVNSQR